MLRSTATRSITSSSFVTGSWARSLLVGPPILFLFLFAFTRVGIRAADHEGVKSGISTHLEFAVVLIEAVLLVGFAVPLWAKRVNEFPRDKDAILVHAIGQQFNWNFHLPGPDGVFGRRDVNLVTNSNPVGLDSNDPAAKDDIVVLGELHVPVNRPVIIELTSKDVIHNFALVNMRIAQDAIPGQMIPMWFRPIKTGNLRNYLRPTLRSRSLRHERHTRRRYTRGLSGVVEGAGGTSGTQSAPPPTARPPGEPPPVRHPARFRRPERRKPKIQQAADSSNLLL